MVSAEVVICTHRQPPSLVQALRAVRGQAPPTTPVVVVRSGVDGHAPPPRDVASAVEESGATVLDVPEPGVARARQSGLVHAAADVVVFLDDDAVPADDRWFDAITKAMEPDDVGAAGGTILPHWPGGHAPRWAHPVLATYFGAREAGPANRHLPFGANMAVRRAPAIAAGGFAAGLGHRGSRPGLHEETELCRRLGAAGLRVVDVPDAIVFHEVRPEQVSLRWVLRRAWGEGCSDAARDRLDGRRDVLLHAGKFVALLAAMPFALVPRWRAVIPARALVNAGYLTASIAERPR